MEFSWLNFFIGVLTVICVEFIILIALAVSVYNKQQKAKSQITDAVTAAVNNVSNITTPKK